MCSPRTRGWSRPSEWRQRSGPVLPAHAGLVLQCRTTTTVTACAPRARGVGPNATVTRPPGLGCSPRTRGWSPRDIPGPRPRAVFPAHAGLAPTAWRQRRRLWRAPRACGEARRGNGGVRLHRAGVAAVGWMEGFGWGGLRWHRCAAVSREDLISGASEAGWTDGEAIGLLGSGGLRGRWGGAAASRALWGSQFCWGGGVGRWRLVRAEGCAGALGLEVGVCHSRGLGRQPIGAGLRGGTGCQDRTLGVRCVARESR